MIKCPICNDDKSVIKNGNPSGKHKQWICKKCNKYFSENTSKGYPCTSFPFPFIGYVLYFYRKYPKFKNNMRKYREFVNFNLESVGIDNNVSRKTIHHWIKSYEHRIEHIITFKDACRWLSDKSSLCKAARLKTYTDEDIPRMSHMKSLKTYYLAFGEENCLKLLKINPHVFDQDLYYNLNPME